MELINLKQVNFRYPNGEKNALNQISFSVFQGEFVVLCGPSGCGKSTLLRQLKSAYTPHGSQEGEIFWKGEPLKELDFRTQSEKIGFVGQSPENQLVTDKVWHELAFGLESMGMDTPSIRSKVAETASFFGIQHWFEMEVSKLSGGQKQLLNLASVMVMEPELLLLDEPTSQLDPIAAEEFLSAIGRINRELGTTVLIAEHRLEELLSYGSRLLVMKDGRITADGVPRDVALMLKNVGDGMFPAMPAPVRIWAGVPEGGTSCPWTVKEGKEWLEQYGNVHSFRALPEKREDRRTGTPALEIDNVWFRYEKKGPDIVKGVSLKVMPGELLAVLGGNGTGKSTMLSLVTGANRPYRGNIRLNGTSIGKIPSLFDGLLGALPQNPQALFTGKTVEEDLLDLFSDSRDSENTKAEKVREVLALCRLTQVSKRHPYDLSGGEQQRAALAKVLLLTPRVLLLDEPTKGMDAGFKIQFAAVLQDLLKTGVAILLVSHDVEFCACYASRCALFFNGTIVSENTPREFFGRNHFYTTAASRMCKSQIPGAITVEDVIFACKGQPFFERQPASPPIQPSGPSGCMKGTPVKTEPVRKRVSEKRGMSGSVLWTAAMVFFAVPLTIFVGSHYLGDQKYLFISLLILLEGMLPFFFVFEDRRPKARELVLIAALCALGVAGRFAFYMLPQCKPVAALTIISGAAFGGETGFLVGSLTMLVSDMIFQQGPWTPWQMFAMGMIGFLAGLLFRKNLHRKKKIIFCIYGFLSVMILYGGIMNFSSMVMGRANFNWPTILSYFGMGLPMDAVHAAATAIFLFLLSDPMLEKLRRIKEKYGLV